MTRAARRTRAAVAAASLAAGLALGAAGCAGERSFVLVSVLTAPGTGELAGVAQLRVDAMNGATRVDRLYYPKAPSAALTLSEAKPVTFSVSMATSRTGSLALRVAALAGDGRRVLGYGSVTVAIDVGRVARATVWIVPGARPPEDTDAAAQDDAGNLLACAPGPPHDCAEGATCALACGGTGIATTCVAAGARQPGEPCDTETDCASGAQCLATSCGPNAVVKTCLRFCRDHGDCVAGRCHTSIPCGDRDTGYRACSVPCDPTGAATQGCAPGFRCFVYDGETTDCDCVGDGRIGGDGAACSDGGDCLPGHLCVVGAGAGTCRALCTLAAPRCAPGSACTELVNPAYRIYGACLPTGDAGAAAAIIAIPPANADGVSAVPSPTSMRARRASPRW